MEIGLVYIIITCIMIFLVIAGSLKKGFHSARFTLSLVALFFLPGLAIAFWKGLKMIILNYDVYVPVAAGLLFGVILYTWVFKRLSRLLTFEHELTHALVAVLFFRRIRKFVVTSREGGYILNTAGFGGKVGDHFISLAPYFLPTFTLFSVLMRPFLPSIWFPWYDVWIGLTFSFQTLSNFDELKQNWTGKSFRQAGTGALTKTDIFREGYIFSFIMIVVLKLLFISLMMFIVDGSYAALPEWLSIIVKNSTGFYIPVFEEIYRYSWDMFKKHGQFI
jgi:hypothetical protein